MVDTDTRPEMAGCKSSLELVERAVRTKEVRYVSRAMRQTAGARKGMSQAAMALIASCLPDSELKALAAAHISKVSSPLPTPSGRGWC
jgi:hypothetical protein